MDKPDHKKIGLLGGSFNPAHEGHREISMAALDHLNLDEIWWLVSPGNPLKSDENLNTFDHRFQSAKNMMNDERIIVSDLEKKLKTRFTVDTITKLKSTFAFK